MPFIEPFKLYIFIKKEENTDFLYVSKILFVHIQAK